MHWLVGNYPSHFYALGVSTFAFLKMSFLNCEWLGKPFCFECFLFVCLLNVGTDLIFEPGSAREEGASFVGLPSFSKNCSLCFLAVSVRVPGFRLFPAVQREVLSGTTS